MVQFYVVIIEMLYNTNIQKIPNNETESLGKHCLLGHFVSILRFFYICAIKHCKGSYTKFDYAKHLSLGILLAYFEHHCVCLLLTSSCQEYFFLLQHFEKGSNLTTSTISIQLMPCLFSWNNCCNVLVF